MLTPSISFNSSIFSSRSRWGTRFPFAFFARMTSRAAWSSSPVSTLPFFLYFFFVNAQFSLFCRRRRRNRRRPPSTSCSSPDSSCCPPGGPFSPRLCPSRAPRRLLGRRRDPPGRPAAWSVRLGREMTAIGGQTPSFRWISLRAKRWKTKRWKFKTPV